MKHSHSQEGRIPHTNTPTPHLSLFPVSSHPANPLRVSLQAMNLAENSIFDQFLGLGGPLDGSESSRITRQTKELSDSRAKCDHREFHQDTKTLRSREDVQSGSEGKSSLTKHFSSQEVQVEQWADTS